MKPIDQITKQILEAGQSGLATNLTKSQEPTLSKTGLPTHWVSALFKKLQARYGHKFTGSIEGIELLAAEEWSAGLAGMTGDQIKRGLSAWKGEWPPSLPEFKAACEGSDDWEHKSLAYAEHRKALPAPLCKKEIWEAQRAKLREMGIKV